MSERESNTIDDAWQGFTAAANVEGLSVDDAMTKLAFLTGVVVGSHFAGRAVAASNKDASEKLTRQLDLMTEAMQETTNEHA